MKLGVFIAFWAVLLGGLLVLALRFERERRTAPGAAPPSPPGFVIATVVALIVFGAGVPAVAAVLTSDAQRTVNGVALNDRQQEGRRLFATNCSNCHTLDASHAVGRVGPNLDTLKPPAVLTLDAIKKGRSRGNGTMPSGLLSGTEAKDVAAYIAAVAGH